MDKTLVIMAAGIGSRYKGGIKQLEKIGPTGEAIMEYSIYDAIQSGFNKLVLIIRKDIKEYFDELIKGRIDKYIDVDYCFQDVKDIPEGINIPFEREKPWGTGHAVLCAKNIIEGDFTVINADDFYGKGAFLLMSEFLEKNEKKSFKYNCGMAGFILKNTLSKSGGVSRGVCSVDNNKLVEIKETYNIRYENNVLLGADKNGRDFIIDENSVVSMNMLAFPKEFIDELDIGFREFLNELSEDDIKKEYLIPEVIDKKIKSKEMSVEVLKTDEKWFGVTYKEDKAQAVEEINKLIREGYYPEKLFA